MFTRSEFRSVDLTPKPAIFQTVFRKLSASLFLLVMSLLVALHSPAIGYCSDSESYFVGDHHEVADVCEHDCDGHELPLEPEEPIDHQHLMVSLDTADFQWSASTLHSVPQFLEIELQGWLMSPLPIVGEHFGAVIFPADPPPPDVPIFRRDAALRV
ncbi:MAG: hypothetical protein QNL33_03665 [Akkermansiaceae bacterium]|jgi:hypothetical protein